MTHATPRALPFLSLLLGATALAACSTDFDPSADYQEIPVLYGIVDGDQTTQTIRLDQAFLAPGSNANTVAATQADATQYPDGALEASIQKLRLNGSGSRRDTVTVGEFPLVRELNTTEKEPGAFVRTGQYVYRTTLPVDPDTSVLYRVRAVNRTSGAAFSAVTTVPNPVQITFAGTRSVPNRYDPATSPPLPFQPELQQAYGFRTQARASLYNADLVFDYLEIVGTDTARKQAVWPLLYNRVFRPSDGEDVRLTREAYAFFREFLVYAIDTVNQNPTVRRRVADIAFRVTAGSPQWGTYQQVLNSYSAVSQTVPEYTNVRGGKGLLVGRRQARARAAVGVGFGTREPTIRAFNHFPGMKFEF